MFNILGINQHKKLYENNKKTNVVVKQLNNSQ